MGLFGKIIGAVGNLFQKKNNGQSALITRAQATIQEKDSKIAELERMAKFVEDQRNKRQSQDSQKMPVWAWVVIGITGLLGVLGIAGVFNKKKR